MSTTQRTHARSHSSHTTRDETRRQAAEKRLADKSFTRFMAEHNARQAQKEN